LGAVERPRYTATQVFEQMLKALDDQAFYQADVRKEEGPSRGKPSSRTQGRLQTAPGSKARMEIRKPSKGLMVCDGSQLWVELPDVEQVMRYDAAKLKASGNFFLDLASSVRHYSKAAYKRLILPGAGYDKDAVTALELLPKDAATAGFERLRVWVDHRRWTVLRVLMDLDGVRSDVRFSNITIIKKGEAAKDPKLLPDPKLFVYQPPRGWELFDLD
jgi:outer membrane lipoprotein-sorting protein